MNPKMEVFSVVTVGLRDEVGRSISMTPPYRMRSIEVEQISANSCSPQSAGNDIT
jgi:hypothetical protein